MELKLKRIKLGLTQEMLREQAHVSINTIVALEKGQIDGVRVGTLKKIAAVLNSSVSELFFADEH